MTEAGGEDNAGHSKSSADEVIESATAVQPVPGKSPSASAKIRDESQRVDLRLQKFVGFGVLGLMFAQVVVANLVFVKYADSKRWDKVLPKCCSNIEPGTRRAL